MLLESARKRSFTESQGLAKMSETWWNPDKIQKAVAFGWVGKTEEKGLQQESEWGFAGWAQGVHPIWGNHTEGQWEKIPATGCGADL